MVIDNGEKGKYRSSQSVKFGTWKEGGCERVNCFVMRKKEERPDERKVDLIRD